MSKRNFMVTINNPEGPLEVDHPLIGYCIWQKERGEQGTEHFQIYVELVKPSRFAALKLISPNWAKGHYETRQGNQAQAIHYCSKEDSRIEGPFTHGVPAVQGKKRSAETDLLEIRDKMVRREEPLTVMKLVLENPHLYHAYGRTLEKMEQAARLLKVRGCKPHVFVIFGIADTLKSRAVRAIEPVLWSRPLDDSWCDTYQGQEAVLFDDYRCQDHHDTFFRMCDRYEYTLRKRNHSGEPWMAKRIYITCPFGPERWWPKLEENRQQIYRRITRVFDSSVVGWQYELREASRLPNEINVVDDPELFQPAPQLA